MSSFLLRLRPLTRAGRVLLCIAASVFCALLIVAWAPAHVDGQAQPAPDVIIDIRK